jgi:hypothetical protein
MNTKTIVLKGLFFLLSVIVLSTLIGLSTYFTAPTKYGFVEYFKNYYKFFFEFLGMLLLFGGVTLVTMSGLIKLYNKLFK